MLVRGEAPPGPGPGGVLAAGVGAARVLRSPGPSAVRREPVYILSDSDDDSDDDVRIVEAPKPAVAANNGPLRHASRLAQPAGPAQANVAEQPRPANDTNNDIGGLAGGRKREFGAYREDHALSDDDEPILVEQTFKRPRIEPERTRLNPMPAWQKNLPFDPTGNDAEEYFEATRADTFVDLTFSQPEPAMLPSGSRKMSPEEVMLKDIAEMFPDCSPAYIIERLRHFSADPPEVQALKVAEEIMLSDGKYPKRSNETSAASASAAIGDQGRPDKGKRVKRDFGRVEESKIVVGSTYEAESLAFLVREFPRLQAATTIKNSLSSRNDQFAPTFVYLYQLMHMIETRTLPQGMNVQLNDVPASNKGKNRLEPPPVITDPRLKEELLWTEEWKEEERKQLAAAANETYAILDSDEEPGPNSVELECGCCFAEYPLRETVSCTDGHSFCKTCAKQHAETLFGSRKTSIGCMSTEVEGGCKAVFAKREMRRFLSDKTFEGWEKLVQQEEIRMALGEDGLLDCPFCDFAVIDEGDGDSNLFHCQNPTCSVVSCRKCRKPNHLPKKCGEDEHDKALTVQHSVEEAMTEALVRSCPKCPNSKFYKTDGCNKLTCPTCHGYICYICRQLIKGYDHFSHGADGRLNPGGASKCALWDDTARADAVAVNEAAARALEQVKAANPDVSDKLRVHLAAVPIANARSAMQYRDVAPALPPAPPPDPAVLVLQAELAVETNNHARRLVDQRAQENRLTTFEAALRKASANLDLEQRRAQGLIDERAKASSAKKIAKYTADVDKYTRGLPTVREAVATAQMGALTARDKIADVTRRLNEARARVGVVPGGLRLFGGVNPLLAGVNPAMLGVPLAANAELFNALLARMYPGGVGGVAPAAAAVADVAAAPVVVPRRRRGRRQ